MHDHRVFQLSSLRLSCGILSVALGLAPLPVATAQPSSPAPTVSQPASLQALLDAYVEQAVADWNVPGLAIAVIKNDTVVFAKGYGERVLGEGDAVDADTLFQIGSTTKAFTVATVGLLVDEQKITWDDRVISHLPEFQLTDPAHTREIRIRDLLTHRTGMGNTDHLWYIVPHTPADIMSRLRLIEPSYPFRAGWVYQNIRYMTTGEIVARVSGMPWIDFVESRLLKPLGMSRSIVNANRAYAMPNVARAHTPDPEGNVKLVQYRYEAIDPDLAAAGMIWSSVNDMSRWIRMLLNEGVLDDERILSEVVVAEMLRPQTIIPREKFYPTARLTKPHWTTYALGWFQQDYDGRAVSFHTGTYDGMSAIVGLIPDEELGMVMLANLNSADVRHALMFKVFDLYGGKLDGRDWSAEFKKMYEDIAAKQKATRPPEKEPIPGTSLSLPLERYAGVYTSPLYGHIRITFENGQLQGLLAEAIPATIEHWHYDTFRVRFRNTSYGTMLISFILGPDGKANKFENERGQVFERQAIDE